MLVRTYFWYPSLVEPGGCYWVQFSPREESLKLLTSLVLFLSSFSNKFRRILGLMLLYISQKGYYPFYIHIK